MEVFVFDIETNVLLRCRMAQLVLIQWSRHEHRIGDDLVANCIDFNVGKDSDAEKESDGSSFILGAMSVGRANNPRRPASGTLRLGEPAPLRCPAGDFLWGPKTLYSCSVRIFGLVLQCWIQLHLYPAVTFFRCNSVSGKCWSPFRLTRQPIRRRAVTDIDTCLPSRYMFQRHNPRVLNHP